MPMPTARNTRTVTVQTFQSPTTHGMTSNQIMKFAAMAVKMARTAAARATAPIRPPANSNPPWSSQPLPGCSDWLISGRFGGQTLCLLDRFFDVADHVEGGFRQVVVF